MKRQLKSWSKRLWNDEAGIILVVTTLLFPTLLAFLGLALDMGTIYHLKRRQQKAADAGAFGAGHELLRGRSDLVTMAARNDAAKNGSIHHELTGGDPDITVTVNYPYTGYPISLGAGAVYVEVFVTEQNVPTYFLGIVGAGFTTVQSRAVAGLVKGYDGCVVALNPTARDSLTVVGNGVLAANCGIMVNSNDERSVHTSPGTCLTSEEWIGTVGTSLTNSSCVSPAVQNGALYMDDPLAGTTPPPIPATPYASGIRINAADCNTENQNPQFVGTWPPFTCDADGTYHWSQGRYDNLFQIQGGTHLFEPGIYILNSGLKITGNNTVIEGIGVGFYNTDLGTGYNWRAIDIGAGVQGELSAPTTDPMKGILFWADGNQPLIPAGNHIIGHADMVFTGTIYMPSQHLDYGGSTNSAGEWTYLIADTIDVHGGAEVTQLDGPDPGAVGTPDVYRVTLLE